MNPSTALTRITMRVPASTAAWSLGSLRTLIVAATIVPILLFALVAWDSWQRALDGAAESTGETVAMLHEHALKVFETHDLILQQVDSVTEGRDWDTIARDVLLQRALGAAVRQSKQIKRIGLADATGLTRVSSEPLSDPIDVSDRDYFVALREKDVGTYISAPFTGRVLGTGAFAASRRRTTQSGRFDGVIHVSVNPAYFSEFWKGISQGQDIAVALIRADGTILASYPVATGNGPFRFEATAPLMRAIARADEGTKTWLSPLDGRERIVSYKKLAGYPVYVSFSLGRHAVLARWSRDLAWHGAFAVIAITALGLLGCLAMRRARAQAAAEIGSCETQALLQSILESTTDSVFVLNPEWRITYLNERAKAALAQGRELLDVDFWGAFPDAVGGPFWHAYRRTMLDRVPTSLEAFYSPLDAWFEAHAHPIGKDVVIFFRDVSERKRAEAALRRSEAHLARAQRAAAIGSMEIDLRTGELTWSDEAYRIYGLSRESFVLTRDTAAAMVHEEDRPDVRAVGDAILQGLAPDPSRFSVDYRITRPDGQVRVLHRELSPIPDHLGRIVALAGTIQDVTAKRQAEEQLRESEERYRLAVCAAGCAVWEWNLETNHVEWAGVMEQLFGYASDDIEPTYEWWERRVHPDDRERVRQQVEMAIEQQVESWTVEYRFRRADCDYAIVNDCVCVLRSAADGKPVRMIGAMMNITQRKRDEERLRWSEAHLARAQRVATVGSTEVDFRSGRWKWSDEAYRIHGFDKATTSPSYELLVNSVHEEDCDRFTAALDAIFRGANADPMEYRIVRPDGQIRVIYRECEFRRNEAGEVIGAIATKRDVTELRAAERQKEELQNQLLHAQRMEALGTLAGGIAHDLNNTLVPVLNLAEFMRRKLPEGSSDNALLEVIRQAGERARDLVRQILTFSRRQDPDRRVLDVSSFLRETMRLTRASVPTTIRIEERIEAVPPMLADPGQLHQVVLNLIANASQAIGPELGIITIELAKTDDPALPLDSGRVQQSGIRLSIIDTGCGMDATTLQRVFEPFFTTKEVGQGTGLGLSVVHGIVKGHGGRIEVMSRPGAGTRFDIFLPALVPEMTNAVG